MKCGTTFAEARQIQWPTQNAAEIMLSFRGSGPILNEMASVNGRIKLKRESVDVASQNVPIP
jgi:hypothetical protein